MSCFAQPIMAVSPSDAPILKEEDADTLWKNLSAIGNNSYAILRNVTRIGTRVVVDGSGAIVKVTKYLADHPKVSVCALIGGYYGYCKWSNVKEETRQRCHCQDPSLRQVLETIRRHWRN